MPLSNDSPPLCLKHGKMMTCIKNGVAVIQKMNDGSPYAVQFSDLYECRYKTGLGPEYCGSRQINGFGQVVYNFQIEFQSILDRAYEMPEEFRFEWS